MASFNLNPFPNITKNRRGPRGPKRLPNLFPTLRPNLLLLLLQILQYTPSTARRSVTHAGKSGTLRAARVLPKALHAQSLAVVVSYRLAIENTPASIRTTKAISSATSVGNVSNLSPWSRSRLALDATMAVATTSCPPVNLSENTNAGTSKAMSSDVSVCLVVTGPSQSETMKAIPRATPAANVPRSSLRRNSRIQTVVTTTKSATKSSLLSFFCFPSFSFLLFLSFFFFPSFSFPYTLRCLSPTAFFIFIVFYRNPHFTALRPNGGSLLDHVRLQTMGAKLALSSLL
ncbi:hypothetical protein JOL62DRAFT_419820 [Phyllosticta paracitricarpa]|uniref:Uncharacterized protein n=1 Tax=Phyllosticta paracitricarpa TaxID=2016321 RepID=A0ABR1NCG9_9PEZI